MRVDSANGFLLGNVSMDMRATDTADFQHILAHAGWLRRFSLALVRDADEAEDLAQDAMLSAWRHPEVPTRRGWLARVARNLAIDRFRRGHRRQGREQAVEALRTGRVATPEELIGNAQVHERVAKAVVGLAEPFRQTIVLRFYEGLSCADIARRLGAPEGTVRWRLKEGLDRVRRDLDARYGDDRAAWLAALAPLVPSPITSAARTQPDLMRAPAKLSSSGYAAMALVGASIVSLAVLGLVAWRAPSHPRTKEIATTKTTRPPRTARPVTSNVPILDLGNQPQSATEKPTPLPPGPGRTDAQTLVEELLEAIQGNDYDAFVAKGSAPFRAAVQTRGFASLSTSLGKRLARGHRVSMLGSVRRAATTDWELKIEFADGGDDGLVTLAMDGWQVAGFLVDAPTTQPAEK